MRLGWFLTVLTVIQYFLSIELVGELSTIRGMKQGITVNSNAVMDMLLLPILSAFVSSIAAILHNNSIPIFLL